MAKRDDLVDWVQEALLYYNGSASIVRVCRYVWNNYEEELRRSGDLFYTWQYAIRWAATYLRSKGVMLNTDASPKGIWKLK
jgi:hypothetical protein